MYVVMNRVFFCENLASRIVMVIKFILLSLVEEDNTPNALLTLSLGEFHPIAQIEQNRLIWTTLN